MCRFSINHLVSGGSPRSLFAQYRPVSMTVPVEYLCLSIQAGPTWLLQEVVGRRLTSVHAVHLTSMRRSGMLPGSRAWGICASGRWACNSPHRYPPTGYAPQLTSMVYGWACISPHEHATVLCTSDGMCGVGIYLTLRACQWGHASEPRSMRMGYVCHLTSVPMGVCSRVHKHAIRGMHLG